MVYFPCCKINLGLDILSKREDGYHDIETVMFPVAGLQDILEIVPLKSPGVEFSSSGLAVDCRTEDNLCVKAYRAVGSRYDIGGVKIHLHKMIPFGAGLGGGSADAAFTVKGLSEVFSLGLSVSEMKSIAAGLGSDTAFFIECVPAVASGRGERLSPVEVDLNGMRLVIVKPPFGVSTAAAYGAVTPAVPQTPLTERISLPVERWREAVGNDFEGPVFTLHPELAAIKERLYGLGAVYASLSGSGSALYGLFPGGEAGTPDKEIEFGSFIGNAFPDCFVYHQVIGQGE